MSFKTIIPDQTPLADLHQIIVGAVSPRPIALVSTVDAEGNTNLAPYSFFNAFSSNPPTLVFSSNRKVKDGTTKHTLHNALETKELVVNMVSHSMVRQMALCSIDYDKATSEFEKSGFGQIASEMVKAPRVLESPVQFECMVDQVIALGEEGGAGNLIVCKILRIHANESIFDEKGRIDPKKLDTVGRMGRAFYTRPSSDIFRIFQPVSELGLGFDQLPKELLESDVLSGNNLAELASINELPEVNTADAEGLGLVGKSLSEADVHQKLKEMLENGQKSQAWGIILALQQGN